MLRYLCWHSRFLLSTSIHLMHRKHKSFSAAKINKHGLFVL